MLVSIENSYLLNNKDVLLVNNKKKLISFFIPEIYNQITSNTATNIAAIALSLCNVKLIKKWFAGRIFFYVFEFCFYIKFLMFNKFQYIRQRSLTYLPINGAVDVNKLVDPTIALVPNHLPQ